MNNKFASSIIFFLFWLSLPSFGALKIGYKPENDQINYLQKSGVIREDGYVNEADAHDFMADHPNRSPEEMALILARHAFEKGMIDELLDRAQYLSKIVKAEDKIIFLGRTPATLAMVFAAWQAQNDIDLSNIKNLNFSGTPDMRNARMDNPQNENAARNLVTAENLEFFENYLSSLALNNLDGKLYIVDMIGTGSNLNSFLRILVHYYSITLKKPLPDIYFVSILHKEGMGTLCPAKTGEAIWKYGSKQKKLAFSGLPQYGFRKMTIDTIPLGLSQIALEFFDLEQTAHFTAIAASFSAYRWSPAHLGQLKAPYQKKSSQFYSEFLIQVLKLAFEEKIKPSEAFFRQPKWELIPAIDEETYMGPRHRDFEGPPEGKAD